MELHFISNIVYQEDAAKFEASSQFQREIRQSCLLGYSKVRLYRLYTSLMRVYYIFNVYTLNINACVHTRFPGLQNLLQTVRLNHVFTLNNALLQMIDALNLN